MITMVMDVAVMVIMVMVLKHGVTISKNTSFYKRQEPIRKSRSRLEPRIVRCTDSYRENYRFFKTEKHHFFQDILPISLINDGSDSDGNSAIGTVCCHCCGLVNLCPPIVPQAKTELFKMSILLLLCQ